jgi:hypothetical protein
MTGWTDIAALGLSVIALVWAGLSWSESRRSRKAAEDNTLSASRSAVASEASATSAARSALAAEQSAESARRDADVNARRFELEHPAVAFELLRSRGQFLLHNTGRQPATAVRVQRPDGEQLASVERLDPNEVSAPFRIKSTWQTGTITHVTVEAQDMPRMRVPITDPIPGPAKTDRLRIR